MKKSLLLLTLFATAPAVLAGPLVLESRKTITVTTKVTVKPDGTRVTTPPVRTVQTTVFRPTPKPTPSQPVKVIPTANPIDYSKWKPETVNYCRAMFGPNWMYNPSVWYMLSAMGIPE